MHDFLESPVPYSKQDGSTWIWKACEHTYRPCSNVVEVIVGVSSSLVWIKSRSVNVMSVG